MGTLDVTVRPQRGARVRAVCGFRDSVGQHKAVAEAARVVRDL